MASIRLAVYLSSREVAGAERALASLLEGLPGRFDVAVVGADPAIAAWIAGHRPGASATTVAPVAGKWDLPGLVAHRAAFAALRPDVLLANLTTVDDCRHALAAAVTLRGVATVAVHHLPIGAAGGTTGLVRRLLARRLDAIVTVSQHAAEVVAAACSVPLGQVTTIPNGVTEHGVRASPGEGRRALTLARLDPVKGLDVLVDALADAPGWSATIAGRGDGRRAIEERVRERGLASRVTLAGWVDAVGPLFADADCLVLPSRAEGMPLAIIEAMLAGLPILATTVGGVAELVQDGVTGILVPPDDPAALAAALRSLADDPVRARRMGEIGRERALARNTREAMAHRYAELLERLAAR